MYNKIRGLSFTLPMGAPGNPKGEIEFNFNQCNKNNYKKIKCISHSESIFNVYPPDNER
jgi:hypothetical protein